MPRHRPVTVLAACVVVLLVAGCGTTPAATPVVSASAVTPTASPAATPTPTITPAPPSPTPSPATGVNAVVVLGGLADPVDVTGAGDGSGRVFVVEQGGRIRIVKDGKLADRPFLDISDRISCCDERGLLGLAFHPGYPKDPRFFVDYTDISGNTVVASFTVSKTDKDVADPTSEKQILHVTQPFENHNGGAVVFGPDGKLYISLGDGGDGGDPLGNGQNLGTLLAKILRIDIDVKAGSKTPYTVPKDNPFVSNPKAKPEIWLTGLRNPWRVRFDRTTGNLWIGDVGQESWEEVDIDPAGVGGLNYGWNRMEGFHCFEPATGCDQTGLTMPVAEYDHGQGCAIIGGVVVHDPAQRSLDGRYVFGDACSDNLWTIAAAGNGQRTPKLVAKLGRTLSSIGMTEDGSVYATSLDRGELLAISGS